MKKSAYAIVLVLFFTATNQASAQSWTAPTSTPPGSNIASPVNVGTVAQVKNGGLSVNAFTAFLNSYFAAKVGIGASSPGYTLDVLQASATNIVSKLRRGTQGSEATLPNAFGSPYLVIGGTEYRAGSIQSIGFGYTDGSNTIPPAEIGFVDTNTSGGTLGSLVFATRNVVTNTAPSERMRIDNAGNVGIGTPSPSALLTVGDGTGVKYITVNGANSGTGNGAAININQGGSYVLALGSPSAIWGGAYSSDGLVAGANNLLLQTGGNNERMRITSTGNVGIGTTSPLTPLAVAGQITTTGGVRFNDGTTQTTAAGAGQWTTVSTDIYNSNAGNVGVGATPGAFKLDVTGTGRFSGLLTTSGGISLTAQNQALAMGAQGRITGSYGAVQNISSGSDQFAMLWNAVYDWGTTNLKFQNTNSQGAAALVLGNDRQLNLKYKAGPATAGSVFTWDTTPLSVDSSGNLAMLGTGTFGTNAVVSGSGNSYFNGGNLGVGVTAPGYRLDVANSGSGILTVGRLQNTVSAANNSGAALTFAANRTTGGLTDIASVNGVITDITNGGQKGDLVFSTTYSGASSPSEKMRIDSYGQVGIGTSGAPGAFLDFLGGANVGSALRFNMNLRDTAAYNSTPGAGIALGGKYTSGGGYGTFANIIGGKENASDGDYGGYFAVNTSQNGVGMGERMRVTSTGNVGIGTTSPLTALGVTGTITTTGGIKFGDGTTQTTASAGGGGYTGGGAARIPFTNGSNVLTDNAKFLFKTGIGSAALGRIEMNTAANAVAIGTNALNKDTGSDRNTAVGAYSMGETTNGGYNTAVGYYSLGGNTTGGSNTAVGVLALLSNTTGSANIAFGGNALSLNSTGWYNTAIGYQSLEVSTTGTHNVAMGYQSLWRNTTGTQNVAVGDYAGQGPAAASNNTSIGYNANAYAVSGEPSSTTVVGAGAGAAGSFGTSVGAGAGGGAAVGCTNCTFVGYNAQANANTLTNAGSIGNGAQVTASNAFIIGNSSVSVGVGVTAPAYKLEVNGSVGAASFFYTSDRSLKKNIQPLSDSLSKILKLQGVSFDWKKDNTPSVGLIAQDVEKVYPELVNTNKNTGLKSVEYGNLVAPLIEAVKEQQKTIENQGKRIQALEQKIEMLTR